MALISRQNYYTYSNNVHEITFMNNNELLNE